MKKLVRYEKYSRKEVHDIFSPDTKFTPQARSWGMQGIIRVIGTQHDYIFMVTYGKKQSKKFKLKLNQEEAEDSYEYESRKGKNKNEFYNNKNINFEGEIKKNTELGKKTKILL